MIVVEEITEFLLDLSEILITELNAHDIDTQDAEEFRRTYLEKYLTLRLTGSHGTETAT